MLAKILDKIIQKFSHFDKRKTLIISIRLVGLFFLIIFLALISTPFIIREIYNKHIYPFPYINNLDKKEAAIVFGAGAESDILKDRVAVAADLYNRDLVEKIIMSGYSEGEYNEPDTMIKYALNLGVNEQDLLADYNGDRTYETCRRAGSEFNITNAILISQNFHLPRALFLCSSFGINSTGVSSDLRFYEHQNSLRVREFFALDLAVFDVITGKL